MPRRWNKIEEVSNRKELVQLYIKDNKTIGEVASILNLAESSIYQRLLRLGVKPNPSKKITYRNINYNVNIPKIYSEQLAEMIGILLGDGHLTPTQVTVTLGKKDEYVDYVSDLMEQLFKVRPKVITTKDGHYVIYLGSARLVRWFLNMGLVFNKVGSQVNMPSWCFKNKRFLKNAVRGLIDTDGSVYKLRSGNVQMSFCNRSLPLLKSARLALLSLGLFPSQISGYNFYITRKDDLHRYYHKIGFNNKKNEKRFLEFNKGRFV